MRPVCYRAGNGPAVVLAFEDRLRSDAPDVIARLHGAGFRTELLSGDRPAVVEAAAARAGIGRWTAGALPAVKIARLKALQTEGRKVLMVGGELRSSLRDGSRAQGPG